MLCARTRHDTTLLVQTCIQVLLCFSFQDHLKTTPIYMIDLYRAIRTTAWLSNESISSRLVGIERLVHCVDSRTGEGK